MAGVQGFSAPTGTTAWYLIFVNYLAQWWNSNTAAFEVPNVTALNLGYYYIAATEDASTGWFRVTVPSTMPSGDVIAIPVQKAAGAAGSPSVLNDMRLREIGPFKWNNTANAEGQFSTLLNISNLSAIVIDGSGRLQIQYGTATGQVSATAGILNVNMTKMAGTDQTGSVLTTTIAGVLTEVVAVETAITTFYTSFSNFVLPYVLPLHQMSSLSTGTIQSSDFGTNYFGMPVDASPVPSTVDNAYVGRTVVFMTTPRFSAQCIGYDADIRRLTFAKDFDHVLTNGTQFIIRSEVGMVLDEDSQGTIGVNNDKEDYTLESDEYENIAAAVAGTPVAIDLTQTVPIDAIGNTVGGCLNVAHAGVINDMVIDTDDDTLTIKQYGVGTDLLIQDLAPSAKKPLTRTLQT